MKLNILIAINFVLILIFFCIIFYLLFSDNKRSMFSKKDSLSIYLDNIHPDTYPCKTASSRDKKKFVTTYKKSIHNISFEYVQMIKSYKKTCKLILLQHNIDTIPYELKIASEQEIEKGMPFTINNWIVISKTRMKRELNHFYQKGIQKSFVHLLLHEYIHILQRTYPIKFNKFYRETLPFLSHVIHFNQLPISLQKKYMLNPDINTTIWVYKFGTKTYYPLYEIKSSCNDFEETLYDTITLKREHRSFQTIMRKSGMYKPEYNLSYGLHHPNEWFAIIVSDALIGLRSTNKHKNKIKFLQSL